VDKHKGINKTLSYLSILLISDKVLENCSTVNKQILASFRRTSLESTSPLVCCLVQVACRFGCPELFEEISVEVKVVYTLCTVFSIFALCVCRYRSRYKKQSYCQCQEKVQFFHNIAVKFICFLLLISLLYEPHVMQVEVEVYLYISLPHHIVVQ